MSWPILFGMQFVSELRRRNVLRMAILYAVAAWLIMQVAEVIIALANLPAWIGPTTLGLLAIGFPIALVFSWFFEVTPQGISLEKSVDPATSITHLTGRRLDFIVISLLCAAVVIFAYDKWWASGPQDLSIAVLPFENMSADPEQEYFSDGISEELLNVLAQFPGLRVAARTSAFQFKGKRQDIADIARQLNVNHVLEGSVRKSGNRLRITAQLIAADSGYHLWSESWDRELDDVFVIQDEISAAIGEALKIQLQLPTGGSPTALSSVPTTATAQAYEYYLKGRQLINGRGQHGLEEAVRALESALKLDESYAPAHAQLAIAMILQRQSGQRYGDSGTEDVLPRVLAHVDRAFELDPNLAEAFGARTLIASMNNDYSSVLEYSEKALALNPSYIDVINWRYLSFMNFGRWAEAMETMDHMMAVDPISIIGRVNYAFALARTNRIDEALQVADGLARQTGSGSFVVHGLIAGDYLGQLADSNEWYLKGLALDPENAFTRHRLANNFAAIGEFDEARRIAPESQWLVNAFQQRWQEAIAHARQRMDDHPGDFVAKMHLANVLHMSGDLANSQKIYQELLDVTRGFAIIDPSNTSIMPTARMAYGRLVFGDTTGAEEIVDIVKRDIHAREKAGIRESYMLRAAATIAAIEGDRDRLIANLEAAIEAGLRDRFILREPVMEPYQDDPDFQRLVDRLDAILLVEHRKTLQLICTENPAAPVWQPLPATCLGVNQVR